MLVSCNRVRTPLPPSSWECTSCDWSCTCAVSQSRCLRCKLAVNCVGCQMADDSLEPSDHDATATSTEEHQRSVAYYEGLREFERRLVEALRGSRMSAQQRSIIARSPRRATYARGRPS